MLEDLWYKNTVIYSLDLETFLDADGNGVGDFEGLIRRLDYLQTLGIGAVWLAPFQCTPNRDNGYDIADYYGVDPRHGSAGDFVHFVHEAKKRGIKVLIDLVINHTSDQHRWFKESRSSKDSPYRDWYVWRKERPSDWNTGMVFPGVQEATWSYDKKAREYYYHRFYSFQPELNMDHPPVRDEMKRVMAYWLQLGVAGFRVDAVPFLIETPAPGPEQGQQRFEYLAEFRRFMQWNVGDAIMLGEANVPPKDAVDYFGHDGATGIHMMFNFYVNQYLFYALAVEDTEPLVKAIKATRNIPPTAQWANFLRNHDELDLGRLSDEERQKVFDRYGPDPEMQLYGRGLRRRLAPMLGDRRQIELAYSAMFSLPGTPVMRYGDEIGMGEDLDLKERDAIRTPMQWANEPQAGFSTAEKTIHPVISDPIWGYERVNVENQRRDPSSLLNWTTGMVRLRNECPEIGVGSYEILKTGCKAVLAMCYTWRGNSVVVVHNFSGAPQHVRLKIDHPHGDRLASVLIDQESYAREDGYHHIALDAHGYAWYRVGGLNYAVTRQKGREI